MEIPRVCDDIRLFCLACYEIIVCLRTKSANHCLLSPATCTCTCTRKDKKVKSSDIVQTINFGAKYGYFGHVCGPKRIFQTFQNLNTYISDVKTFLLTNFLVSDILNLCIMSKNSSFFFSLPRAILQFFSFVENINNFHFHSIPSNSGLTDNCCYFTHNNNS